MKRIALAAAGAVVVGLTACSSSHTAAPASAPASHGNSPAAATPVSCSHQYHIWTHGQGEGLIPALQAVSMAGTAGDRQVLAAALKRARPAVAKAARHPMPACADPRGYWSVLLMHVNAAAARGSSASNVRAAITGVPKIEHELTAEVKRTTQ